MLRKREELGVVAMAQDHRSARRPGHRLTQIGQGFARYPYAAWLGQPYGPGIVLREILFGERDERNHALIGLACVGAEGKHAMR